MSNAPITDIPTLDQFSAEEIRAWRASRKEAGGHIDIESCEIGCWFVDDADPYEIGKAKAAPPADDDLSWLNGEAFKGKSRHSFVRSPKSRGWIWDGDLPAEKRQALAERERREEMTNRVMDAIAPAFEPEPALTALVIGVAGVMTESPLADDARGRRRILEEFIYRVDERITTNLKNSDWANARLARLAARGLLKRGDEGAARNGVAGKNVGQSE